MRNRGKHAAPYDPSKDDQPSEGYTYCDKQHSCFHSGCLRGACGGGKIGDHCFSHDNGCHFGC
jgi:hypothetical protein